MKGMELKNSGDCEGCVEILKCLSDDEYCEGEIEHAIMKIYGGNSKNRAIYELDC